MSGYTDGGVSYSLPVTAPSSSQSTTNSDFRRSVKGSPPPHLFAVRAAFPYKAQNDDELSFGTGQLIYVTGTEDDPWWFGSLQGDGAIGLFPSNYVQRL